MKVSETKIQWVKSGAILKVAFVGRDCLLYGSGCHLIFYDVKNENEIVYTANNNLNGDGVKCFAGHRTSNVFAFIEHCPKPIVYVYTYPTFEKINMFKESFIDYLSITFSDSSILITLAGQPNYNINVWNWRSGERIASKNSIMTVDRNLLRCNLSCPIHLAQLGEDTKFLHVWDIYMCGKKCTLYSHEVEVPSVKDISFTDVLWTSEGTLFTLDSNGSIYTMNNDHQLEQVIEFNIKGNLPTSFTWFKMGIVVSGPNNELRHYKKSGVWNINWTMCPIEPLQRISSSRGDYLIGISMNNNVMEIIQSQNTFKYIKKIDGVFNDFSIVYPLGEYIVTLHKNSLNVFKIATGEMMSHLHISNTAMGVFPNPDFPYVAVPNSNGILDIFSVFNPKNIIKIESFYLTEKPLEKVYFCENGLIFIVGSLQTGEFYVIEGIPGGQVQVVTTIEMNRQIVDFMVVYSKECLRIFAISVTSDNVVAGNKLLRYCIVRNEHIDVKEYTFATTTLYYRILCTSTKRKDRYFYIVPYIGKSIEEGEIKKGHDEIKCIEKIPTGHQLRKFNLDIDKYHAVTWSKDGFVIVRNLTFSEQVGMALAHHRTDGGVKKALIDPYGQHIISLGYDNTLVCTTVLKPFNDNLRNQLEKLMTTPTFSLLFSKQNGPFHKETWNMSPWIEIDKMNKIADEREESLHEQSLIFKELNVVRKKLKTLLTKNIDGPDNEKLDIQEFILDRKQFEDKSEYNRQLCKATDIYLKNLIKEYNNLSDWLLDMFWKKIECPSTTIEAINENFRVENYAMLPMHPREIDRFSVVKETRRIENLYGTEENVFHPWLPKKEKIMSKKSIIPGKGANIEIMKSFENVQHIDSIVGEKYNSIFVGSDSGNFVEPNPYHIDQRQLHSAYQIHIQNLIAKEETYKLKNEFNKEFELIQNKKLGDMGIIVEKNARLRHIVSEINYFSVNKINPDIIDPDWKLEENPQLIIKVDNNEVPVLPYISPSEQSLINARLAEAERLRLLLLADDFKDRALIKMMNGVLEIKWEDELKKNIPLPKCILEKEPETFNEEELKVVKEYQDKVEFLKSEKERYKNMLWTEFEKTTTFVMELMKKFNMKLRDLLILKMKMESAIGHENLKIKRAKLNQFHKLNLKKKEIEILNKISINEGNIQSLHDLIVTLHQLLNESRANLEALQAKEKHFERALKRDFQETSILVQEQVYKLYKKRPKATIRNISSSTILTELTKCIVNGEKILTLNQEALEFLKSLDNLDLYVGISPNIDEHSYNLLCKHRRLKIEYEVKVKIATLEVAEAETTIAAFHKYLSSKKDRYSVLLSDLTHIRNEQLYFMYNMEMQIVLPRGYVEIPMNGKLENFEPAILVCRKDVEEINKNIQKVGNIKLKSLKRAINFRNGIDIMEWEHKKLRMQIQDLENKLQDINNVTVSREMLLYLRETPEKRVKMNISFESQVELIKKTFETTIRDLKETALKFKRQILTVQKENKILDKKISDINIDVCEYKLLKNKEIEYKEETVIKLRLKALIRRSKLVQQLQQNHNDILVLQTELELLRLKTYPTLKYKFLF